MDRAAEPGVLRTRVSTWWDILEPYLHVFPYMMQALYMIGRWFRSFCGASHAHGMESKNAKKLRLTRMAAGHGEMNILKCFHNESDEASGIPDYIVKAYDATEVSVYEELQSTGDALLGFTARYCGEVAREQLGDLGSGAADRYMRLSNLLKHFERGPNVMDCKLGIRSFGESEVTNTKLRPDLYQRLAALDPDAPTEEERKAEACTKYRWMSWNDGQTTLKRLGFRIDGIARKGQVPKSELRQIQTLSDMAHCIIKHFLPRLEAPGGGGAAQAGCTRAAQLEVARAVVRRPCAARTSWRATPSSAAAAFRQRPARAQRGSLPYRLRKDLVGSRGHQDDRPRQPVAAWQPRGWAIFRHG
eukprot:CAMPEP_0179212886 /NCGR_PEP_ID=MMETSP0797-20121207/1356_1 /TAXON_ID=47934 /ORGANISM="Dinophysis acuminata, Strain DAEP01" /LENGTH=358 /DNA_ID=CAMNT_0020918551 /DNA_START=1 /DNA_END=1078 /DNA_ORIENTATION=-